MPSVYDPHLTGCRSRKTQVRKGRLVHAVRSVHPFIDCPWTGILKMFFAKRNTRESCLSGEKPVLRELEKKRCAHQYEVEFDAMGCYGLTLQEIISTTDGRPTGSFLPGYNMELPSAIGRVTAVSMASYIDI